MRATFLNHYEFSTESKLIEAFYRGEDAAFGILAERLYPLLKGLALSRIPRNEVGRYELAEDLVQETLFKVARTKDRPLTRWQCGKSAVSTWVGTILKNLIRSHLRTKKNRIRVTTDMGTDLDNNAANRLENQLVDYRGFTGKQVSVQEGQREHWRQAIAALPQEFHVLISMQLQGKSHREIASRLGMARSTVTYRIKNATKLLRNTSVA